MSYFGIKAKQAGVGNVYFVCLSGSTIPYAYLMDHHQATYLDGSTAVQTTVTLALAATVSERNDYVIVMPDASDYDEGATLTMDKTGVHLICPGAIGSDCGISTRLASLDPNTSANVLTISGRGNEVAGFWLRGYDEKYCASISGTGNWIHHNDCAISSSSSAAGGIDVAWGGYETRVERNYIFSNAGTDDTIAFGIKVSGSATRTQISNNRIVVSNGNTMTYGIKIEDNCNMCIIDRNIVIESPHTANVSKGVLTNGISLGRGSVATNNTIGMVDPSNAIVGYNTTTAKIHGINNIGSLEGGMITQ